MKSCVRNAFASTLTILGRSRSVCSSLHRAILRANAQTAVTNDPPFYGPFNATFLPDGDGLKKALAKTDSVLRADSPWSLYAWVKPEEAPNHVDSRRRFRRPIRRILQISRARQRPRNLCGSAKTTPSQLKLRSRRENGTSSPQPSTATIPPLRGRHATRQRQTRSGKRQPSPRNGPAPLARLKLAPLRRRDRLSHSGPRRLNQRRHQTAFSKTRRFLHHRIRRRLQAVARPNPRPSRISRAARSRDHAAQPRSIFHAPSPNRCPSSGVLQPNGDSQWTLAAGWRMIPATENKCRWPDDLAAQLQLQRLDARHRPRHRPHHHDRSRHLSRSRLWSEQSRHPRKPQ